MTKTHKSRGITSLIPAFYLAAINNGCAAVPVRNPELPYYVHDEGSCIIERTELSNHLRYGQRPFKTEELAICDVDGDDNIDRIDINFLGLPIYNVFIDKGGRITEVRKLSLKSDDPNCPLGIYSSGGYLSEHGCKLEGKILEESQRFVDSAQNYFRSQEHCVKTTGNLCKNNW